MGDARIDLRRTRASLFYLSLIFAFFAFSSRKQNLMTLNMNEDSWLWHVYHLAEGDGDGVTRRMFNPPRHANVLKIHSLLRHVTDP
jgi:hypothetical protein